MHQEVGLKNTMIKNEEAWMIRYNGSRDENGNRIEIKKRERENSFIETE